jgi:hypothetical protein
MAPPIATEDADMGHQVRRTITRARKKAKKMGRQIAHAVSETPELISLQRAERSIRQEIDDELLAIGKRVRSLYRKSRNGSPFERYVTITNHLEAIESLESEYQDKRTRLNQLREEIREKGR